MLNAHDREGIAACVTDGFFNEHTSQRGHSVRGRAAYRERLTGFLQDFEDLSYEIEDLVVDGERAAMAYLMRFRWHEGPGSDPAGGATSGVPVVMRGMFWFEVEGGLIAHRRDYFDGEDFARQVRNETAAQ